MLEILAGFVSGIFSSMGMGGGSILIMLMSVFFGMEQLKAQGINLLYFVPVALLSVWSLKKEKLLEIKTALLLSAGGIPVAVTFCFLALNTDGGLLRKGFGLAIFLYGVVSLAQVKLMKR